MLSRQNDSIDKIGLDETVVDETGVDKLGIALKLLVTEYIKKVHVVIQGFSWQPEVCYCADVVRRIVWTNPDI